MKRIFQTVGLILTSLVTSVRAQQATEPPASHIVLTGDEASVPMKSFEGRPLVDVMVNGKGPFPFVIDTAASHGRIGMKMAKELGLEPVGEARARSGVGEAVVLKLYNLASLRLGGLEIQNLAAAGWDPPNDDFRPAVLPVTVFADLLLTLDFPAEKVIVRRGELPAADSQSIFTYKGRLQSIPVTIGGVAATMHPDSGASGGIAVPKSMAASLSLDGPPKPKGKGRTINAEFEVLEAQLHGKVQWGRFSVDNPDLRFIDGLREPLLGTEVLRHYALTLDQKNSRIRFAEGAAKPASPTKP